MRIELSWKDTDGQHRSFMTGCPKIAEAMLRSGSDFPQVTPDIKQAFRERYGSLLGSFEQHLRDQMQKTPVVSIETNIPGLTVRVKKDEGVEFC
jgi:hypothetical protein